MISRAALRLADGSVEECSGEQPGCRAGSVELKDVNDAVWVRVVPAADLDQDWPASVRLDLRGRALALTLSPDAEAAYSTGFAYFNELAAGGRPDESRRPPENVDYPPASWGDPGARASPWPYPVWLDDASRLPPMTVGLLAEANGSYVVAVAISSGGLTGYLWPGPELRLYAGARAGPLEGYVMAYHRSSDPYDAIEGAFRAASRAIGLRLRKSKARPEFSRRLGWCSWNAFLSRVTEADVLGTVKGLLARGVPIRWALIDDGWESLEVISGRRALASFDADRSKFPGGLKEAFSGLSAMGVSGGLWTTINGYWGGLSEGLARRYGAERLHDGSLFLRLDEEALRAFYRDYLGWAREQGASLVKVDNQVWLHLAYRGLAPSATAASLVERALQDSAGEQGLELLMCMSMVPEAYSNFSRAAVSRVSNDYIPFWKAGAKLHIIYSAYASTFFSSLVWPDFDMFMSYDQHALAYAVTAALSGGPIYITDRDPSRTNVGLLRRLTLPSGELATVDEPGVVTRGLLLRDPYNEGLPLKIASESSGDIVIGVINVSKAGAPAEAEVSVLDARRPRPLGSYAYYMSVSGSFGLSDGRVRVRLGELEAEVVTFADVSSGRGVIGIKELLVPPAGVSVRGEAGKVVVRARTDGTLLYYSGGLKEVKVREGEEVEV